METITEKMCSHCSESKPVSDFTRDKRRKDGLNPYCRECTRSKNRLSYKRNFATEKARKADYYLQCRDEILARNRAWRDANRERTRATNTAYYWENRDKVRGWHKAYHQANPNVARASVYRRRALKEQSPVYVTAEGIEQRMKYFGYRCWMCGGPFEHVDHVKPLSKGGLHALSNLRPACAPCNLSKKDKWPVDPSVRMSLV